MKKRNILVVEDDGPIRQGLVDALESGGYNVISTGNGKDGLVLAIESDLDLVLLDVMLPEMNGFDVLRHLRRASPTLPVIMVTARGAENDRVEGLSHGADDYVLKPFSARELLARVEAVLRRSPARPIDVRRLSFPGAVLDLELREVTYDDDPAPKSLSEREVGILRYLATNKSRVVQREELLQNVWGLDPRGVHTRTIDMHIARLREKLPAGDDIVRTVRGKGYTLGDTVEVAAS